MESWRTLQALQVREKEVQQLLHDLSSRAKVHWVVNERTVPRLHESRDRKTLGRTERYRRH